MMASIQIIFKRTFIVLYDLEFEREHMYTHFTNKR